MIRRCCLAAILAAIGPLCLLAPAAGAAAPQWRLTVIPSADYFVPGVSEGAFYTVEAENTGDAPTSSSESIVLEDILPSGLAVGAVHFYTTPTGLVANPERDQAASLCPTLLRCEYPGSLGASATPLQPGDRLVMVIQVDVQTGLSGSLLDAAKVRGGGASKVTATGSNEANSDPPFSFRSISAELTASSGANPYTQAAGHPNQFSVEMNLSTRSLARSAAEGFTGTAPVQDPQEIAAVLPPGLAINPQGVPTCELADFYANACPISTVIGTLGIRLFGKVEGGFSFLVPLFNLQPQGGFAGELGYVVGGQSFLIHARVLSGSDYAIDSANTGLYAFGIDRVRVTLWGSPAEGAHDALRGKQCSTGPQGGGDWFVTFANSPDQNVLECEGLFGSVGRFPNGGPAEVPETPLITLPTECSGQPLSVGARAVPWANQSEVATAQDQLAPTDGCGQVRFEPTISVGPTTNVADASSGLEVGLHVPQGCWNPKEAAGFEALCQSDLKDSVVRLPQGLVVNPAAANGRAACSPQQIGLTTPIGHTPAHFTEAPAECPDASKLGTALVDTPLLHEPLGAEGTPQLGAVYLATPHDNPFDSLLAAYIVLEGQGLIIKLPGEIEVDQQTGRITGRFPENPQLPFEDFGLRFFGGARGALRTPPACGTYTTTSVLTPWSAPESGPPAEPSSSFQTTQGAGGRGCPAAPGQAPNAPVFRAGTESAQAGAFSPFALRLAREDGSQEISKLETTLPPGLVGKLAGLAQCSEAQLAVAASREHEGGGAEEQASPSCPASSEVGTVEVAAGAGPTPLYVTGHAYLAGPYKGAPLSLAIVTPAVAGPFDLGDVLVRTALYVDPFTAQIKAISDEIPHILQGIPLDVRSITLKMGRPDFTLNPTNCEELRFEGSETSLLGQSAPLAQRFQVGGCRALPFKPKLSLRLKGSPRRAQFPSLTATLTMPHGDANIASAQVTLPHSSFLAQAHIAKTCGRPELASHTCPTASIYGHATAVTPLLDHPLEGPVYLATGFGYQLPALVADLNGQIEVMLKGKVDSGREDGIRNTFEVVPDAPVSRFTLHMFGGKRSLIENSQYLCAKHTKRKALARFTGQNGKTVEVEPTVANSCKKKHKGGKGHSGGHHKRHGG